MSVIFMLDCDCWSMAFFSGPNAPAVKSVLGFCDIILNSWHLTHESPELVWHSLNHKLPLFKHNLCAPSVLSSCPVFQEFPSSSSSCWRYVLHIADCGGVWTSLNRVQTSFNGAQVYNPFPRYFVLLYSECFLLCKCVPCYLICK